MALLCHRLQVIPRWIMSLLVGVLIGWTTFSLNSRLYQDTDSSMVVLQRSPSLFVDSPTILRSSGNSNLTHSTNNVPNIPPKYQPTNKFDLLSWQYFDKTAIFSDVYVNMVYWRHSNHHMNMELEEALKHASTLVGQQLKESVRMKELTSGYVRHNPTRGYEYIIDAVYVKDCRNCVAKPFSRRVSFVRPPSEPVLVHDVMVSNQVVNVIVPISNVNERFNEFIEKFGQSFLKVRDPVHLLFVVYQDDISKLQSTVEQYRSKYKSAKITLLQGQGAFSRGRALHHGISSLKDNDLIFICDVDITIERSFMNRCRRNTIQGKRVFYPVVFKQYNSKYARSQNLKPGKASINRKNGHWFYYSYGMLCIYKSDYTAVGGLDIQIEGWGLEDVLLFEAILKAKLEVLKVPDPALTHRWHESHCPDTLTEKQHSDCLGSLYEGVADKKELAQYIYEQGYQIHDK